MKKIVAMLLAFVLVTGLFAGCGSTKTAGDGESADGLKVAALVGETGVNADTWKQVCAAFEAQTGTKVNLVVCKNQEELLAAKADVIHSGEPTDFIQQLIKDKKLHDLTGVLSATIPGESVKVADKIENGFLDSAVTMPYGDGKTYVAPMFYTPWGMFYNYRLFEIRHWDVPTTWDEMWVTAEQALADDIYLFTYPKAEDMEAFMCALMHSVGGVNFFNAVVNNEEGIWDSKEARNFVKILEKIAKYTHPETLAYANDQDYNKNQLLVILSNALFMPECNDVTTETLMATQSISNGTFGWGMRTLPTSTPDDTAYTYAEIEQMWIPADAAMKAEAEQFIAFMYSDKATELFAAKGAVQPIKNASSKLDANAKTDYVLYETTTKAALNSNAINPVIMESFNQMVDGTINANEFLANVKAQ